MAQFGSAPEYVSFIERQEQFAAHIRDPERAPPPADVDPRRMGVYCELFYNNVEGQLATSFPVLREITEDARWHALVRDFFARHRVKSPRFLDLAQEFLCYLADERAPHAADPPFLRELAHYEWVELELSVLDAEVAFSDLQELKLGVCDAAVDSTDASPGERLLARTARVSPLARNLRYAFPVHRIGAQTPNPEPVPTFLLVVRDRHDAVGFMEVNAVSARLVELLQEDEGRILGVVLEQVAAELGHPDRAQVIRAGVELVHDLVQRDVLIWTTGPADR